MPNKSGIACAVLWQTVSGRWDAVQSRANAVRNQMWNKLHYHNHCAQVVHMRHRSLACAHRSEVTRKMKNNKTKTSSNRKWNYDVVAVIVVFYVAFIHIMCSMHCSAQLSIWCNYAMRVPDDRGVIERRMPQTNIFVSFLVHSLSPQRRRVRMQCVADVWIFHCPTFKLFDVVDLVN